MRELDARELSKADATPPSLLPPDQNHERGGAVARITYKRDWYLREDEIVSLIEANGAPDVGRSLRVPTTKTASGRAMTEPQPRVWLSGRLTSSLNPGPDFDLWRRRVNDS
jgi:hypothetical protein